MAVSSRGSHSESRLGESRWPPAAALLVFMALNVALRVWLPTEAAVRVPWLVPAIEVALLAVLLLSDPLSLARRAKVLRPVTLTLVVVLVVAALWATSLLVYDLIKGIGVTESPSRLLASGAVVWLGNNLSFALNRTTAGRMASVTYLIPVVAILLGWVLLGETPPALAWVGGALCLGGVYLARRR